jgi:hypothetical protein
LLIRFVNHSVSDLVSANIDSADKFVDNTVRNSDPESPASANYTGFDIEDVEDFDKEPSLPAQPVASSSRRQLTPPAATRSFSPIPTARLLSVEHAATYKLLGIFVSSVSSAALTQELRNRQDLELQSLQNHLATSFSPPSTSSEPGISISVTNSTVDDLYKKLVKGNATVQEILTRFSSRNIQAAGLGFSNSWLQTELHDTPRKRKEGPSEVNKPSKKQKKDDKKGKGKAREE